jgi:hypothetical protein
MSTQNVEAQKIFSFILNGDQSNGYVGAVKAYHAMLYDREIGGRRYAMGSKL